jgi:molybdate transport system substrate-binding protein
VSTEITVRCTNGIKESMIELVPAFERAHDVRIAVTFGSTKIIMDDIEAGAAADLLILTAEAIDELTSRGKVAAGSRVDVAKSGIGVAVRAGAPRPDIGTPEALRRALLAARTVGYSKVGASGIYTADVLIPRLGLTEEMKSRAVLSLPGSSVGILIADGKAEIGLQQISELVPIAGIDVIGPLPAELQKMTTFSAGVAAGAAAPVAARALAHYLAAPSSPPVMRRQGLEPA